MQIASRQCVWDEGHVCTEIGVVMTKATGLYLRFFCNSDSITGATINWGDGEVTTLSAGEGDASVEHTYRRTGAYTIKLKGVTRLGLRMLDGHPYYNYDAAILSIVDYSGDLIESRSASWQRCLNLKKYIAPNVGWMGQRDFAYCSSLKEVVLGDVIVFYDGTFQYCSDLQTCTMTRAWEVWHYVWKGCTALKELHLGNVYQFGRGIFESTPNLKDIWISNKTVAQIQMKASSGNIVKGSAAASFPWGASSNCRFHGTDGIVLGNGTQIQ